MTHEKESTEELSKYFQDGDRVGVSDTDTALAVYRLYELLKSNKREPSLMSNKKEVFKLLDAHVLALRQENFLTKSFTCASGRSVIINFYLSGERRGSCHQVKLLGQFTKQTKGCALPPLEYKVSGGTEENDRVAQWVFRENLQYQYKLSQKQSGQR
mgnify:CR=1 FL=1|jgi:hypothetical protein